MSRIDVRSEGARQIRDLARRCKQAGRGDLQRQLGKEIRAAGVPLREQLRAAAKAALVTSSEGGRGKPQRETGLRDRVARGVTISATRRGVRIKVRPSAVAPGKTGVTLPKYLDGSIANYRRWRHPVFGHTDRWVQQSGSPWFFATIRQHSRQFRKACFAAIARVERELTR